MSSRITSRFFQVFGRGDAPKSFAEALQEVAELTLEQRTQSVDGQEYRLERHQVRDGVVSCEIVRIQTDNLPAEVTPEGLDELPVDQLGFGIAFCYEQELSVLAMQYDNKVVSASRLCEYLLRFSERNDFWVKAVPGPDLWTEFGNGSVQSFVMRVAAPKNFNGAIGSEVEASVAALSRAYDAPFVSIGLSVGHRKSTLRDLVKDAAGRAMTALDVRSMKAKVVESPEEIDLLDVMLGERDEIKIPKNPSHSYTARRNFVLRSLAGNRRYLEQFVEI